MRCRRRLFLDAFLRGRAFSTLLVIIAENNSLRTLSRGLGLAHTLLVECERLVNLVVLEVLLIAIVMLRMEQRSVALPIPYVRACMRAIVRAIVRACDCACVRACVRSCVPGVRP